jgi:glycosyltransferase involved in cell wall biosynthesis
MRILHCTDSFWPRTKGIGGIQIWLSQLSQQQVKEGHTVGVVTWAYPECPDHQIWNGVEVFRLPVSAQDLMVRPEKMRELLAAWGKIQDLFRPEVIHSHLNQLAAWACTLGARIAPIVLTVHVPADHDGIPAKLRQRVMADAECIVVPSHDLFTSLVSRDPDLRQKLCVIAYGLQDPSEPITPPVTHPMVLLCLGRLVPEKGFDVALSALARSRPDFRLILAGEGSAEADLRAGVKELGIEEQVHFAGWVHPDQIPALISTSTVVLMPSRWREPFGLVAVQAAQMGRPIIASDIGGIPEIVVDGETGLLVTPGDPEALAQAMVEMADDPDRLSLWGGQARRRAEELFSLATCCRRYHEVYVERC